MVQRISRKVRKFQNTGGALVLFLVSTPKNECARADLPTSCIQPLQSLFSCTISFTPAVPPAFYPQQISTSLLDLPVLPRPPTEQACTGDIALPNCPPIPSCRVSQPALLHPLTHQLIQHGLLLHKQAIKTQANYVLAFLYLSLFVLNQSDISAMISLL